MYPSFLRWAAVGAALVAAPIQATVFTTDSSVTKSGSYEFVIVGGGLTGLVVANKLSKEGHSVLVIEAGPDARGTPEIDFAEKRGNLTLTPELCNWNYVRSNEAGEREGGTIDSGRCLGGSSSINGMVWYKPTRPELDAWEALGSPGWNWNTLEPYMRKVEKNKPPTPEQIATGAGIVTSHHGFNGNVNVSFPEPMRIPDGQVLYKAGIRSVFPGIPLKTDLSDRAGSVVSSTSWTISHDPTTGLHRRSSAADAFLFAPDAQRAKLTVLTGHKVHRVLFDAKKNAIGVVASTFPQRSSNPIIFKASKEVILAGGTLSTPAILEHSGIGGASILNAAGVKQLVDLPGVGMNLQDQPGAGITALLASANMSNTLLVDNRNIFAPVISLANLKQVFEDDAEAKAAELVNAVDDRAQRAVAAGTMATLAGAKAVFAKQTKLIVEDEMPILEFVGESYPAVLVVVLWPLLPFSRGHIHITSTDAQIQARIVPRFLTETIDLDIPVKAAQKAHQMFQTLPFAPIVADPFADPASLSGTSSDEDYAAWYKSASFGASHWVGSCSLLPREIGGVVDPNLKVYGTQKLRIVDMSIVPIQITSHTMPLAYAVSQRAADLILADY